MRITKNTRPFTEDQRAMFVEYRTLASSMCRKFVRDRTHGGAEFCDDMKCAASLGLLLAAQRYDPEEHGNFARYAKMRIWAAMVWRIYENATGTHHPGGHRRRVEIMAEYGLRHARRELQDDVGLDAVDERDAAWWIVGHTDERRGRMILRRVVDDATLRDIAAEEGTAYSNVDRLIRTGLDHIRSALSRKEVA